MLYQIKTGVGVVDTCKIFLERNAIVQRSSTHPDSTAYFFICDSERTNTKSDGTATVSGRNPKGSGRASQ